MTPLWRRIHPEGIPWPASALYNAVSKTSIFQRHYQLVADDILSSCSPGSLLDIGTGPGWLLVDLHRERPDARLAGVDISPAMVSRARENLAGAGCLGAIQIRQAAADSLPFPDGSFDAVVGTGSLHHWRQPARGLDEVYRVLKPGGSGLLRRPYVSLRVHTATAAQVGLPHGAGRAERRAGTRPSARPRRVWASYGPRCARGAHGAITPCSSSVLSVAAYSPGEPGSEWAPTQHRFARPWGREPLARFSARFLGVDWVAPRGAHLMYDLVKHLPEAVREDGLRRFGRLRMMFLALHSLEEPFYDAEEMRSLASRSLFGAGHTRFVGVLCCLVLQKAEAACGGAQPHGGSLLDGSESDG